MRALLVVVLAPAFDDDPCLRQAVEDLAIQKLVAELRVEALTISVLPGAAGLDVGGSRSDGGDPLSYRLGDELRAIARWEWIAGDRLWPPAEPLR
jgi:hypothetical protein